MNTLTHTQRAIHAFIAERIVADGVPPSQSEIANAFNFSGVRAAQYHIEALERAGVVERTPGRARGLRLLQMPDLPQHKLALAIVNDNSLAVPVLGRVSAGLPIGADIGSEQTMVLDRDFFSPTPDYLLIVQGDSMIEEGILDGDLIGVHRTPEARNGQIVVARVEEEITVKQLEMSQRGIRLLPRNANYDPIVVQPDQEFAIEGLFCGLVRPSGNFVRTRR